MFPTVLLVLGLLLRMDVESYQRLFFLSFISIDMIMWFLYFFVHVFGLLNLFLIYAKKIKNKINGKKKRNKSYPQAF